MPKWKHKKEKKREKPFFSQEEYSSKYIFHFKTILKIKILKAHVRRQKTVILWLRNDCEINMFAKCLRKPYGCDMIAPKNKLTEWKRLIAILWLRHVCEQ